LAGALLAAPFAAHGHPIARAGRAADGLEEDDAESQLRLREFKAALCRSGWIEGRNLKTEVRWAAADVNRRVRPMQRTTRRFAADVIVPTATPRQPRCRRRPRRYPSCSRSCRDPVGSHFVKDAGAGPGGNITGFVNLESSLVREWLQSLKGDRHADDTVGVDVQPRTAPLRSIDLQPLNGVATEAGREDVCR